MTMSRTLEGRGDGKGLRVAIVVSKFNRPVTDRLLEGARACLVEHGCDSRGLLVVRVPGAWELPQAAARLVARGDLDAIVALGAVIRGETAHFDFICQQTARGLTQVGLDSGIPVIFGVLTTDSAAQALARSGRGEGDKCNKGEEAALAALEMVDLYRQLAGDR
jgi:6,7-dimethyl-8-ribityllumazine synthase